jgi:hypothetical protein
MPTRLPRCRKGTAHLFDQVHFFDLLDLSGHRIRLRLAMSRGAIEGLRAVGSSPR